MLIHTADITKIYNDNAVPHQALNGVNLDVDTGEFTVLAGPSGSGKTTLLNIIGALDSPTEGTVLFNGEDISTCDERERSSLRLHKIGFVFQAYNLINVLSAWENVDYVLLLQGLDDATRQERITEVLHAVGLDGLEHRRPSELSGGQQQRVAVARALASRPKLVLADEPTANLDQNTGKELVDLMQQLNGEHGITFLISSHDEMVIKRARRCVSLLDGEIVEDTQNDAA